LLVRRSGSPAEAGRRAGRCPPAEEGSIWANGLGTVPDPSRAGAEIVGRGRGAGSGPFEVPADGTHSAQSGPRTDRGGATRDTRKAIPSGGGAARTDRPVRLRRAGRRLGADGA